MNNICEAVITAITPNGSATLPFVIPSVAEGSAVHAPFLPEVFAEIREGARVF
jgi:hypothetical protein